MSKAALKDAAYFCPKCGSSMVNTSSLAGGEASCDGCKWRGRNEDLLGHAFDSGFDSPEQVLLAFARDIKLLLARNGMGVQIGEFLIKWGFVQQVDVPTLARYLTAIARAIANAVVEERRNIEKEKIDVS